MNKILIMLAAVIFMICIVVSGCSAPATTTTTATATTTTTATATTTLKPIELKYASFNPETHAWSQAVLRWQKKVTEGTNGQVTFENYFSGTLVTPPNAVREIADGVADLGAGYIAMQKSGFELSNAVRGWVYGTSDLYTVLRVDGELYNKYSEIRDEYKDVKVLGGWLSAGPNWLNTNNKPVRSLDDIKGLTFKSSAWLKQFESLGGAPLAVPMPDAYISIQKGIIDGLMSTMEVMDSFKLAEVTKYHTDLGLCQGSQPEILFNWDAWNSLPANVQQVFESTISSLEEDFAVSVIAADEIGMEACIQGGHEFIEFPQEELDKLYEVMDTVSAQEAAELDAKGYPGTELFNEARRLIALYSNN